MKRVSLPVLVDRRLVLRGMAATLLATLAGCGVEVKRPDDLGGGGGGGGTSGGGTTGGGTGGGTTSGGGGTGDGTTGGGATTGGGTGGTAASPGFAMCGTELCIDLGADANAALREIDGARVITLNGRRLLIVRTDELTFVALSAVCTHAGCTVRYDAGSRDVACPCHGSTFELDGRVTAGPAQSPLDLFAARYDAAADVVTVTI
jgi:cytochrome b6-f complex iron-sulfur subunit